MKLMKPLGTTLGAAALTVVAAGSALAVNAGILRGQPDTTVGTLDPAATVVADSPLQPPNVRYVTIYVDDPSLAGLVPGSTLDAQVAVPGAQPTATDHQATAAPSDDDAYEHEYEGADDDD